MKPTFPINYARTQRDAFAAGRKDSTSPQVEYFFQAPAPEFSGHRPGDRVSFRSISRDYFAREARGHFKSEALIFGATAIAAAIPVVESIRGLARFVYGVL